MGCSCHKDPPCTYCENMPEEVCILVDDIRILEKKINNHTRTLKDIPSNASNYGIIWDERVDFKADLRCLEQKVDELYPD